jgi:hypothetical protein
MSWLPDVKRRILAALLIERLDHFELAGELGEAVFRIRAELQDLRRDRLVTSRIEPSRIAWELTDRGALVATADRQLTIDGLMPPDHSNNSPTELAGYAGGLGIALDCLADECTKLQLERAHAAAVELGASDEAAAQLKDLVDARRRSLKDLVDARCRS